MTVRIGFGGDVMLGRGVDRAQQRREVAAVWDGLLPQLTALDGLLINLECALSTRGRPWTETYRPFHFRADPDWAVPALERAGVDCCALANNHVLDYGPVALGDTLAHLDDAGIARAGAGEDTASAWAPARVTVGELDVAVVSCTDNTSEYAAGADSPGTAHVTFDLDDRSNRERVASALDRAREGDPDLLVASLHWGPNMEIEPPAAFREFGRWLVERGVDVVHGHSAHVVQGIEVHEGRPILYDCGDFVDDYRVDPDLRNDRGFLFVLELRDGRPSSLSLLPIEIADRAVNPAEPEVAEWCRERMRELSAPFGTAFQREDDALVVELDG